MLRLTWRSTGRPPTLFTENEFINEVRQMAARDFAGAPEGPVLVEALDDDSEVSWRGHCCTGDFHMGTNDKGVVPGVDGTQHFMGRRNLEAFLKRIVPTFPHATRVLLTGNSASGIGSWGNVELVQKAFGSTPVSLIDFSGPPLSSPYIPACLQDMIRNLFGYDDSFLKDCGSDCPNHGDWVGDYTKHLLKMPGAQLSGLISSTGDAVVTALVGAWGNDCTTSSADPIPADVYEAGLVDLRQRIQAETTRFGTYYIPDMGHYGIDYTTTVNGTRMVDWVRDIIDGTAAAHVGP